MKGVLSGVTALEFSEGWTGAALCGRMLAELGAEVIKVETPHGDPLRGRSPTVESGASGAFSVLSAGKRSAVVDLDQPMGRSRVRDLAARADILLDGLPFGTLGRLGMDWEAMLQRHPRLVFCSVSVFGRSGPLREWHGADLLAQAMSGLMSTTGFADGPPMRAGVALGEHAAAAFATSAIVAALFDRLATVLGQHIDIAALDCLFLFQSSFVPSLFVGGKPPPRQGFRHPLMAPWDVYPARDASVVICSGNDNHWRAMLGLFGRTDLLGDQRFATTERRVANVEDVNAVVAEWTSERMAGEVIEAMQMIGIPAGPILTVAELFEHQQFRERELMLDIRRGGTVEHTFGSLFKMSRTPGRVRTGAPALGEYAETAPVAVGAERLS